MLEGWTSAVMWLLPALVVGLAILAGAMWTLRRQRACPSCRTPMQTLARPGDDAEAVQPGTRAAGVPSYEVLVCDGCCNAATLVHGHQSRFAYCPACLNRSLRTPCIRRPDGAVKVEERCDLCGFRAERTFHDHSEEEAEDPPMGQVIPFPTHRVRREASKVDEA